MCIIQGVGSTVAAPMSTKLQGKLAAIAPLVRKLAKVWDQLLGNKFVLIFGQGVELLSCCLHLCQF